MSRSPVSWPLMVALPLGVLTTLAGAQTDSAELRELRELRVLIEQQNKQIEALSRQISEQSAGGPAAQKEKAQATPEPAAPPVTVPPASSLPPVSPSAPAGQHVVAKGETLTSIAKHYNIGVTELQKGNKIENDRKLQIGQILIIPPSKSPEPQTEKKENP